MLGARSVHGNGVQFNLANAWFARISRLGTVPHPRENCCIPGGAELELAQWVAEKHFG